MTALIYFSSHMKLQHMCPDFYLNVILLSGHAYSGYIMEVTCVCVSVCACSLLIGSLLA